MKKKIHIRKINPDDLAKLGHLHPVLARLYAARGVSDADQLDYALKGLPSYQQLKGIEAATERLLKAVRENQRILIIGDFDADGATSSALAVSCLRAMGAKFVEYLVPDRFTYGYGLTPEIVDVAVKWQPDVLVTVDNGIASIDGVAHANKLGIDVVITDHHLAGKQLPEAVAIVNPNQPGCEFPVKSLAGVGVIFYVMLALRAALNYHRWFNDDFPEPNMSQYLDLVALGTYADVVPLEKTNRILVSQGLRKIRAKQCRPGILALVHVAKRQIQNLTASDLGFVVGPRLNAAGRLDDMAVGIECLLTDNFAQAQILAQSLDELNHERKNIEADMKQQAMAAIAQLKLDKKHLPAGLCLFDSDWHQGVIGILAGRVKEQIHRPVIAFAKTEDGGLKGSARSIPQVHIRDILDNIATKYPGLICKFGGHAMAAGLSLKYENLETFRTAFAKAVSQLVTADDLAGEYWLDGELGPNDFTLELAELVQAAGPWGQSFPEPLFINEFKIMSQRIVGARHLKLSLQHPLAKNPIDAIAFNIDDSIWPNHRAEKLRAIYKLDVNEYNGFRNPQLIIDELEPL